MVFRVLIVTLALFLWLAPSAHAITGEEFTQLSEEERHAYTSGVVDGLAMFASGNFEMIRCIEAHSYRELHDMFRSWLTDNPERWRMNGGPLMFMALKDRCPGMGG